jgi:2-amino-4-hydroxy-6-hydroxymethyldihydropteridine diphosphokinase
MLKDPVTAYIALGANLPSDLGDAQQTVLWAAEQIQRLDAVSIQAFSSLYRTAPMDSDGPDYINAVMAVSCPWSAYSLLSLLQKIEQTAGRERPYTNAPRTLDLDLLLYGDATIQSEQLSVPHPRMWQRAFVLAPLREIAPQWVNDAQWHAVRAQQLECLPSSR